MISSDKPLADFSWATVVLYFCAIDHSVSPRSTLCDAASTSCAAKIADAIAAVAETDITIFLLDTNAYTLSTLKTLLLLIYYSSDRENLRAHYISIMLMY